MIDLDLPEQWSVRSLRSLLATLESGSRPRGGVRGITDGVPSIGGEHLTSDGGFNFASIKYVPRDFYDQMRRGRIQTGDVLIVKDGATTGKVALVQKDFRFNEAVVNEHVFVCRPRDVDSDYLFWFLHSAEGQRRILEHFKGSAQGGITLDFAEGTLVPVAPKPIQKVLAGVINAASARGRSAAVHIDFATKAVGRFRLSVLEAACSGRLTRGWRSEVSPEPTDPIASLLPSEDADINEQADLAVPHGWRFVRLGDVLKELKYGTSRRSEYSTKGVPVLRIPNVSSGQLDVSDLKFADLPMSEAKQLALKRGDILMVRSNGSVDLLGRAVEVTEEAVGMSYAGYLIRLRVKPNHIEPKFLTLVLAASQLRRQIEMPARSTSGVHNINTGEIRRLGVPVPPLAEQLEIIGRVSELLGLAETIAQRVRGAERSVDRSWQRILSKAFRGEIFTFAGNEAT